MTPAVVLVAYRLPPERIAAHRLWNFALYARARTYVVTDRPLDLPGAEVLVYPRPLAIFSLAKTKNFGLRQALDAGCDPLIATDADIAWTADAWIECADVGEGQAIGPVYHMVDGYETRHALTANRVMAELAIGTIAMRASGWQKVCGYNERLEGYGCDDGDLWRRIGAAGLRQYRGAAVYHVAHQTGAVQQEAHTAGDKSRGTRTDHWGRQDKFNPDRLQQNLRLSRQPWASPTWGQP